MTPLDCAKGMAEYLAYCFQDKDEEYKVKNGDKFEKICKDMQIYAGFLPRTNTRKEMIDLCPAIVVRPEIINDGKDDTKVTLLVYVTVYDEDMKLGCESLYHLLEFVRYELLSENPIEDKWQIVDDTLKTTIPDNQPFPQWLGAIELEIYLPQPIWTPPSITGDLSWQKRKRKGL